MYMYVHGIYLSTVDISPYIVGGGGAQRHRGGIPPGKYPCMNSFPLGSIHTDMEHARAHTCRRLNREWEGGKGERDFSKGDHPLGRGGGAALR